MPGRCRDRRTSRSDAHDILGLFAALPQARSPRIIDRIATAFAAATILGIGFGLGEGLALALGTAGDICSLGTIIGYLTFSGWLSTAGLGLILNRG